MYALTGTLYGEPVDVLWDDGHIEGSPGTVSILRAELEANPELLWGEMGAPRLSGLDVLSNGTAFFFFFRSLCPDCVVADGELPDLLPPLEEGQIP